MRFERAVAIILEHEGGYVNHPSDPGGETKFGISKRAYPNLEISKLTIQEAIEIYRRDFWDKYRIKDMPDLLRLPVFDACVNQGPKFTITTLQKIVGAKTDGVIGPKTLLALSDFETDDLVRSFLIARHARYASLKTWSQFGVGWMRRLLSIAIDTLAA